MLKSGVGYELKETRSVQNKNKKYRRKKEPNEGTSALHDTPHPRKNELQW